MNTPVEFGDDFMPVVAFITTGKFFIAIQETPVYLDPAIRLRVNKPGGGAGNRNNSRNQQHHGQRESRGIPGIPGGTAMNGKPVAFCIPVVNRHQEHG